MPPSPSPAPDYRSLFEAAPNPYLVLTPEFVIVGVTDAYLRATRTRREDILGRHIFDVFPDNPQDPQASGVTNLRASLERAVKTRSPDAMAVQKYDIPRPEGAGGGFELRYWSPLNTPVFGEDGEVRYVIHRVEDVTDFIRLKHLDEEQSRQHAELRARADEMEGEIFRRAQQIQEANQQLRVANEQLGELDRLKSEFFANVSHEFRTPLTLMLGPTEDLLAGRAGPLSDEVRKEMERVHRNAGRLLKLVNALLDLSKLEAGPQEERFAPTDLAALTKDAASSFRSAMERAGLKLTVDCPPLSQPVYVAPDLWEQIVLNLVSNAFKFTLQGGVTLRLREHGQRVALEVEDTGSGIPAHELPRLFERFHRVPGSPSRTMEGSGIGLALVQEFARLHGGAVSARSTEGEGSVFTVELPLGHAHLPPERIRTAARPRSAAREATSAYVEEALLWGSAKPKDRTQSSHHHHPASADGHAVAPAPRARILLVDDNRDMRDYIQRVLSPEYDVEVATDGQKGLEAALTRPPDLVLSDVMMPKLDGMGLLRALRAAPTTRELPILLLSAKAGEEATVQGLASGADDYLVKPFSAGELLARIASNLKLARMRGEMANERARAENLTAALRARDDFLSVAAHELRTPLAAFQLHLELVERGLGKDAPPKALERLKQARSFIRRLAMLVDVLMDVSQITSGRLKITRTDVDLGDLLVEVTRFAEEEARRDGTPLTVDVKGPVMGTFDPSRISQVVHNLVANALKFGRGRPVDVSLQPDGEVVRLSVVDHGIGIKPEDRERIFDRFERAVSTHHYGGLGLGLWVSRQVVEAHQGRIDVEDTPGGGTTFRVTLPLRDPPVDVASPLAS
ncbi:multi-sensor Hybrid histidine Kinase [Corallococcus coralloides DSM 2259]|uniref:histidine kinase n=1 Tax=Corallococcus coralloides (strain ATCC 25202 / DSM 2259 / NBRC 100086 / M2) TaxID=1144275 RepID=H8MME3_CORCM|nr:ATP-binding protein [Corallococcus coralloides]AFE09919.1 multi-sensor Hybrid histidine Kinase [Corallococcus coralloides DSM 2259]